MSMRLRGDVIRECLPASLTEPLDRLVGKERQRRPGAPAPTMSLTPHPYRRYQGAPAHHSSRSRNHGCRHPRRARLTKVNIQRRAAPSESEISAELSITYVHD